MSQQPETSLPITQELKQIFDKVMTDCSRSFTKQNLHLDPAKENILDTLLNSVVTALGLNFTAEFQKEYENKDPATISSKKLYWNIILLMWGGYSC